MKALIASDPRKRENKLAVSNSDAVCGVGKLGCGWDRADLVQKIQQSGQLIYESYYGEGMVINIHELKVGL